MDKSATLNLRINPEDKLRAEAVLKNLGIPMSVAVSAYLKQIALTGSIPFKIALPEAPASVNANLMTPEELRQKLEEACLSANDGNLIDAEEFFAKFYEERGISESTE